ncbi:cell filamentation protein Fic [Planctomycetales bacterium]|nr:cell filamentation protein Fic [Planctomycetales bacterium]
MSALATQNPSGGEPPKIDIDALWATIEKQIRLRQELHLNQEVDYEKFYLYSLVAHSTAIEGSVLTELDAQLLFDDGITAKGKPLVDHLMNRDLKDAYLWAKQQAREKAIISVEFLQSLNARIMKSTGGEHKVVDGSFDASKGDFRLCGVSAGLGGASYLKYEKIPAAVSELCGEINRSLPVTAPERELYQSSFDAHFHLATIHPWVDGNGRAARLLMNYLQFFHRLIPVKVYQEDKVDYITALKTTRETADLTHFRFFMTEQLRKTLDEELNQCPRLNV